MKPALYVETSVVSYLTARPSRDIITAARQQLTQKWWRTRGRYELFASQFVLEEAGAGHKQAARQRLKALQGLPLLQLDAEADALAKLLRRDVPLPERAAVDALHLAVAVVGGMDYLLTWNFKHLANASLRNKIEDLCRSSGYTPPVICTPEELLGE
ncbi:MAG: type II toxin-antitoxin system VapC family toxin [Rhodothermales bacterium]